MNGKSPEQTMYRDALGNTTLEFNWHDGPGYPRRKCLLTISADGRRVGFIKEGFEDESPRPKVTLSA